MADPFLVGVLLGATGNTGTQTGALNVLHEPPCAIHGCIRWPNRSTRLSRPVYQVLYPGQTLPNNPYLFHRRQIVRCIQGRKGLLKAFHDAGTQELSSTRLSRREGALHGLLSCELPTRHKRGGRAIGLQAKVELLALMKTLTALLGLAYMDVVLGVGQYYQCGGINGITAQCDAGLVCVVQSAYYFQCLPYAGGLITTGTKLASTSTSKASTTTTIKSSSTSTKPPSTTSKSSSSAAQVATVNAVSSPTGLTTTLPASSGYVALSTASVITGTFDGGMKRYDRKGSSGDCQGQTETGEADAVFILQSGATIQNVIIGADQAEGIHCRGPCTIKNVWWADVCEDALTILQTGAGDVSYIIGGGAFHAEDKIIQHNGAGTVSISSFFASDFGKLYRACGNCSKSYERHVIVNNVGMHDGFIGVGVNENFGDTAVISKLCTNGAPTNANVCCRFKGVTPGNEPPLIGCGPSGDICKYTASEVTAC